MTNLLYELYRRHCPEKWRQSCVMHFCMLVELTKLDASICLKLFKHWSESIAEIEAYHPYRQSVVIILSTFMMMWLLWLLFNDTYRRIMSIMG